MRRLLVRIVGVALCASALTGCGMMGGDDSAVPPRAGDTTPIATDTTAAIRQAQLLRVAGDLAGAQRMLSQLMLGSPDDPRIVGEYGKLLVQQGRATDAVQFLRRAIELQPGDWMLYSALGVAYDQLNDQTNARTAYEHALVLKPGEPAVLNNFAMSRMLAGDTAAARTLMLQAQASGSTDPKIAANLALLDAKTPPPVQAVASAAPPAHAVAAMAPRTPVVVAAAAPAHGTPLPIVPTTAPREVLGVPVDSHSDTTGRAVHPAKPAPRIAKLGKPVKAKPPTHAVAANMPAKPAKPAKPSPRDHIPALRMTADASKP